MSKFKKGMNRPTGAGRKAGTPNKIKSEVKDAMAEIILSNAPNLKIWFEKIAKSNPAKAMALHIKMCEFIIPKADKSDFDSDYPKLPTEISIVIVDPKTTNK